MKKWPIAFQVYSVRADAEKDFAGTMKALKEMGYDGVELAGTYGMTVAQAKAILDEVGLAMVSAHVPLDQLECDDVLDAYAAAGLKLIALPWLVGPKTAQELAELIQRIKAIGTRCKARGMQLLYHNHDFEFEKIDGAYILDTMYAQIPADLLQTELDCCWVRVGGEKPEDYLTKYAGRAPVVHLKDYAGEKSSNMYALLGGEDAAPAPSTFQFRPVGYGVQNVPDLVEASEKAGAQWLIVEQDEPSMGRTPMECAKLSVNYLKSFL